MMQMVAQGALCVKLALPGMDWHQVAVGGNFWVALTVHGNPWVRPRLLSGRNQHQLSTAEAVAVANAVAVAALHTSHVQHPDQWVFWTPGAPKVPMEL